MSRIYEVTYDFLDSLEEEETIRELKKCYQLVQEDKELMGQIDSYYQYPNEELKNKILSHEKILNVQKKEAELAYLILEINQVLGSITDKKGCL